MTAATLAAGLVLLLLGGDLLIRAAVGVAERLRISPLMIGLVLVGFGTSTPELLTSVQAALADAPGIAIGNVVGSNIANILLILGAAALIHPLAVNPQALRRDGTVMALAALACLAVTLSGTLSRTAGALLLLLLGAYVIYTYVRERRAAADASAAMHAAEGESATAAPHPHRPWVLVLMLSAGLALVLLGAHWLVTGAIDVAGRLGLEESVIGLTIVAVGTSLPELATSAVATLRRQTDVALGNVLGSNIFNVLGILGVTALVRPLEVPPEIARGDIWVMLAATALLLLFAATGRRIDRLEGALFVAAYAGYLAWLALRMGQ